jgi:hypothetical protein
VIEMMNNPTIIYTDNFKQSFEAIRTTDKGIIIGRLIEGKFIECGFILKRNIKRIEKG